MIKCVIFDFCDTIINNSKALERMRKSFSQLKFLRENGFQVSKEDYLCAVSKSEKEFAMIGFPAKHAPEAFPSILFKNLGLEPNPALARRMNSYFHSEFNRVVPEMPNARRILSWLASKKVVLVCLTNAQTKASNKRFKKLDFRKYFNKIFVSEALGFEKASVVPFQIVLDWLKPKGISVNECLMVGNDPQEDMLAKHAGIRTVLLEANVPKPKCKTIEPDYRIKNLIELKKIIRGLDSQ